MATITASSNLYNSFKLRYNENNGAANLASAVTIEFGNDARRNRLFNRNLLRSTPSLSCDLTVLRYGGVADLTPQASLSQTIPTFIRLDFDKMNLPEGVEVRVDIERGFFVEETEKYPDSLGNPSPAINEFFTFTMPERGTVLSPVNATLSAVVGFRRFAQANITDAMNFTAGITYSNADAIILTGGSFLILPTAVKDAVGNADINSQFSITEQSTRLKFYNSTFETAEFTTTAPSEDARIRFGVIDETVESTLSCDNTVFVGFIQDLDSEFTQETVVPGTIKGITEELQTVSSVSCDFDVFITLDATALQTASSLSISDFRTYAPMILEIDTTETGVASPSDSFGMELRMMGAGIIEWGDGNSTTFSGAGEQTPQTHTYASPGVYEITIKNNGFANTLIGMKGFKGFEDYETVNYHCKITKLKQWGDIAWREFGGMFAGANNMEYTGTKPNDIPRMTNLFKGDPVDPVVGAPRFVTLSFMFAGAELYNQDLGDLDVREITSFASMFSGATAYNQDLSSWEPLVWTNINNFDQGTPNWTLPKPPWGSYGYP